MEQPARQSGAAGCQGLSEKLLDDRLCRPCHLAPSSKTDFVGVRKEDMSKLEENTD